MPANVGALPPLPIDEVIEEGLNRRLTHGPIAVAKELGQSGLIQTAIQRGIADFESQPKGQPGPSKSQMIRLHLAAVFTGDAL